jgi:folate-binding protein YgfZ
LDVIGDDIAIPEGWPVMDVAASESDRILAGMPAMGAEIDERTIPAETGAVPVTVSFTKGCYTGQELVARVDSRGNNVPRRLRLLRLPTALDRGTELLDGAASVGTITSVAADPSAGWVGLGYTKRGIDMPARLTAISAAGDRVEVRAEEIPA